MRDTSLENLVTKVARLTISTSQDACKVAAALQEDGLSSRSEAEFLLKLRRARPAVDRRQSRSFNETIVDYLLTVETPVGWITQEKWSWLTGYLTWAERVLLASELDLLLDVLNHVDNGSGEVDLFILRAICAFAVSQGQIDADTVTRVRRALCRVDQADTYVTRVEAVFLLKLNDQLGHAENDAGWNDLFARAISNHLIGIAQPAPAVEGVELARHVWLKPRSRGVADFLGRNAFLAMGVSWFEAIARNSETAARAKRSAQQAAWAKAAETEVYDTNWISNRLGLNKSIVRLNGP